MLFIVSTVVIWSAVAAIAYHAYKENKRDEQRSSFKNNSRQTTINPVELNLGLALLIGVSVMGDLHLKAYEFILNLFAL